jgi:hypothetical protein
MKESSNDATAGQSIAGDAGGYVYFENVDFGDSSAAAVELRVAAQSDTTLELRGDSETGPLLGACALTATGGAWATQMCQLTETSGVGREFVSFGGAARLNWLKFQPVSGDAGTEAGDAGAKIILAGTSGGDAGSTGSGGSTGVTGSGTASGCGCGIVDGGWRSATLALAGAIAILFGARTHRARRRR